MWVAEERATLPIIISKISQSFLHVLHAFVQVVCRNCSAICGRKCSGTEINSSEMLFAEKWLTNSHKIQNFLENITLLGVAMLNYKFSAKSPGKWVCQLNCACVVRVSVESLSRKCVQKKNTPSPGCEFLSDAPFFGLSLWTQFKLALCACASGWSSTLEPRSKLGDGSIWSIQL